MRIKLQLVTIAMFLLVSAAAVFADGGNALRDFQGEIAVGAGVGARWISPVGQIRIDFAWGFQAKSGRIHFVIGPDF